MKYSFFTTSSVKNVLGFLILSGLLTSCEQTQDMFGFQRTEPDEFTVLEHPPLSVPPSLHLKPPAPSQHGKNQDPHRKAKTVLLKTSRTDPALFPPSLTEKEFLNKAGQQDSDPLIREKLEKENAERKKEIQKKNTGTYRLPWQKNKDDEEGKNEEIDPQHEKEMQHQIKREKASFNPS